jgi:hypothetical protein
LFQLWRLGGWWIDCRGLMEMASRRWLISFTGWIALLMCFFLCSSLTSTLNVKHVLSCGLLNRL